MLAPYSVSGNVHQGGGIDQYGNSSAIMNFEISAQGMGAKYVLDGTDYCAAMFNPEGDMGDVEMWELISPFVYLSRRVKASSGGPGRHRGGSSFESLFMVNRRPSGSCRTSAPAGCCPRRAVRRLPGVGRPTSTTSTAPT